MHDVSNIPIGRLLANTCRLHATRIDQNLEALGFFRGQAILLVHLSECDGQAHSEIAEQMQISPAAATKVIKRMEALNYVQRRPDPNDERISRVYLRSEGRAIVAQIRTVFKAINEMILAGFTEEEQETLRALLLKIHLNLQNNPDCQVR